MFPIIHTIDDIKEVLGKRNEVAYREYPEYGFSSVWYYMTYPGMFSKGEYLDILKECRGLIFDLDTGIIISRKYQKSFNYGEESFDKEIKNFWWMEKLDGTMISFVWCKDKYIATSKAGRSDVAIKADFFGLQENYIHMLNECRKNNWTAIFEYCGPDNQIIIPYKQNEMILTAIRHNFSGEYIYNPEELMVFGQYYNIPVVKSYQGKSINFLSHVEEIQNSFGIEGNIVRFNDGMMLKVKSKDYLKIHNIMELFSLEKNVLQYILEEKMDDILPILPYHFRKKIEEYQIDVNIGLQKNINIIYDILHKDFKDKKDFVEQVESNIEWKKYKNFLYPLFETNKTKEIIYDFIIKFILKNSNSSSKINKIRYIFT